MNANTGGKVRRKVVLKFSLKESKSMIKVGFIDYY